jgi:transcriptional regulator with XRE-family HTH domain
MGALTERGCTLGELETPTTLQNTHASEAAKGRASDVKPRDLGSRIRAGRLQRKLTLQELASQISVSASHISQIERGVTNPSVSSLLGIAGVLQLPMEFFFTRSTRPEGEAQSLVPEVSEPFDPEVLKPNALQQLANPQGATRPAGPARERRFDSVAEFNPVVDYADRETIRVDGGIEWRRLTPIHDSSIAFLEIRYEVGASDGELAYRHHGREYGVLTQGKLLIELGFSTYVLEAGQSISFDCAIPHRFENAGDIPMTAFWVVLDQY